MKLSEVGSTKIKAVLNCSTLTCSDVDCSRSFSMLFIGKILNSQNVEKHIRLGVQFSQSTQEVNQFTPFSLRQLLRPNQRVDALGAKPGERDMESRRWRAGEISNKNPSKISGEYHGIARPRSSRSNPIGWFPEMGLPQNR